MSEMPASCLACGHACFSLDLMAGLNPEKRSLILSRSRRIHLERDETLFESGDPVQALYLLHRGRVKLTSFDTEGREQITGILSAGDTLWEDLFEPDSRWPFTCICLEDADLCRLDRDAFAQALQDPALALQVISLLSRKLRDADHRNLLLSTPSPLRRLAGFLLFACRSGAKDTVVLRLDDIAGSISLRPETVSRKLSELEKAGLVKRIHQSCIRLLDPEGLNRVFSGQTEGDAGT